MGGPTNEPTEDERIADLVEALGDDKRILEEVARRLQAPLDAVLLLHLTAWIAKLNCNLVTFAEEWQRSHSRPPEPWEDPT